MSEPIFRVDTNVGFEWSTFALYRHPEEPSRYVASSASGCSCNWFKDPSDEQLCASYTVDRAAARNALLAHLRPNFRVNPGSIVTHLERFEHTMNSLENDQ